MSDDELIQVGDDEVIQVRCERTSDSRAMVPSIERPCAKCGVPLWVSKALLQELEEGYPGRAQCVCFPCIETTDKDGEEDATYYIMPSQLAELEAAGMSDPEIAMSIALTRMVGPGSREEEALAVMAEMQAHPLGPVAFEFIECLLEAKQAIARARSQ